MKKQTLKTVRMRLVAVAVLMCFVSPALAQDRKPTSRPASQPAHKIGAKDIWHEWEDLKIGMVMEESQAVMMGWNRKTGSKTENGEEYDWVHSEQSNATGKTITLTWTVVTWFRDGKLIVIQQPMKIQK